MHTSSLWVAAVALLSLAAAEPERPKYYFPRQVKRQIVKNNSDPRTTLAKSSLLTTPQDASSSSSKRQNSNPLDDSASGIFPSSGATGTGGSLATVLPPLSVDPSSGTVLTLSMTSTVVVVDTGSTIAPPATQPTSDSSAATTNAGILFGSGGVATAPGSSSPSTNSLAVLPLVSTSTSTAPPDVPVVNSPTTTLAATTTASVASPAVVVPVVLPTTSVPVQVPVVLPTTSTPVQASVASVVANLPTTTSSPVQPPAASVVANLPATTSTSPPAPGISTTTTSAPAPAGPVQSLSTTSTDSGNINLPGVSVQTTTSSSAPAVNPPATNLPANTATTTATTSPLILETTTTAPAPTTPTPLVPPTTTDAGTVTTAAAGKVTVAPPPTTSGSIAQIETDVSHPTTLPILANVTASSAPPDVLVSPTLAQSTPSETSGILTSVLPTGTGTGSNSAWLPTTIAVQAAPTQSDFTLTATTATAIPTNLPQVITPPKGTPVDIPPDSTMVQVGFLFPLNYQFVATNPTSPAQICMYLPEGIQEGLNLAPDDVKVHSLIPYNTQKTLGYVTTLVRLIIPANMVDSLKAGLTQPLSPIYQHNDTSVAQMMSYINPTIPLIPGGTAPGGGGYPLGTGSGTSASSSSTPGTNGVFDPNAQNASATSKSTAAGIAVGAISAAAAYGAAMFFIARRYKKRRGMHRRSSSIQNPSQMRYTGSPALMGGGLAGGSYGVDGRESRGSGRSNGNSARTAQISAPMMAENSLGWN